MYTRESSCLASEHTKHIFINLKMVFYVNIYVSYT